MTTKEHINKLYELVESLCIDFSELKSKLEPVLADLQTNEDENAREYSHDSEQSSRSRLAYTHS